MWLDSTWVARPLAPFAFALTCGLLVGRLVLPIAGFVALGATVSLVPMAVVTVATTALIWRGDTDLSMRIGRGLVTLRS